MGADAIDPTMDMGTSPDPDAPPVQILADDREPADGVVAALKAMPQVQLEIERLPLGDYVVDRTLLFERKTLPDFAQSVIDGRLFRQMIALANSGRKGVLILEGTGRDLSAIHIRREALQGAMITVTLILGIPVLRAQNPSETARLMIFAARQIAAAAQGTGRRPGYRPKTKPRRQRYVLQGLPGIGPALAQRLLEAFGSVSSVMTADEADLQRVPGIGPRTAEKIKWVVSERKVAFGVGDDDPLGII